MRAVHAAQGQMSKYTRREFIKAGLAVPLGLRAAGAALPQQSAAAVVSLAGEWRFALDREDAGVGEQWFGRALADRITLPGILQAQGYGDRVGTDTPWVLSLYKEEIEANLRTPGLGGFQLLDLHDYLGHGTALVVLLDAFWESKGYATPEEFRRFCATTDIDEGADTGRPAKATPKQKPKGRARHP